MTGLLSFDYNSFAFWWQYACVAVVVIFCLALAVAFLDIVKDVPDLTNFGLTIFFGMIWPLTFIMLIVLGIYHAAHKTGRKIGGKK